MPGLIGQAIFRNKSLENRRFLRGFFIQKLRANQTNVNKTKY